jgi:transcriptional regulator GlxA family with amidase domain
MKHLTILVPEGENNLSSIVGSYKIFRRANEYWKRKHRTELFQIELAGVSKEVGFYEGLFAVRPEVHISGIAHTDLVIIPSLNHNFHKAVRDNQALIDWIGARYKEGAELASICTGAFLLAATGLLDGKDCSTHWSAADSFRRLFPQVKLQPDKVVTDQQGIYTNGGAYSFLTLLLYLVEKYYDRETAILCSKVFQIDMDRESQSPFALFAPEKAHGDELVKEAQTIMESNLQQKISVEDLSSRLAVGRRNFDRRFVKATGNTPLEYLQRLKMEAARKALEATRKTVSEVMYEVGYSDAKAFREVFRKITGLSPLDYRRKYNSGQFR